ncbi:MAG: diguanylate cyclase [Idiomarina sp.]|nr:diguanylate cyclase [Idiomarina sp.]
MSQYTLSRWTTRDGLPHNSINGIAQDLDGYIWLATWEGPVRFNGREFKVFDDLDELEMPESGTLGIVAAAEHNSVWLSGPRGGFTRFDGQAWQGLERFPGFVFQLARDSNGDIWAAASGAGVARYQDQTFSRTYTEESGLPESFVLRVYVAPAQGDRAETVWAGTSAGLAYFNPELDRFVAIESVPAEQVLAILLHSSGMLLVGTESGLYYQAHAGADFAPWPGGYDGQITALAEGPYGGVWFGTLTAGLGRLTQDGTSWLTTDTGLPNPHVLTIFKDHEHNMWVSTHGGLVQLRDALFTSYTRTHGLQGNFARAVMSDAQHIWVGTSEGLSKQVGSGFEPGIRGTDPGPLSVLALERAEDGALYVGTYDRGLLKVDDGNIVARLDRTRDLSRIEVRTIHRLSGSPHILVGSPTGLFLVKDQGDELTEVARLDEENGLFRTTVTAIAQVTEDTLYLASTMGISRLTMRGPPEQWRIEHIDLEAFTASRNIFDAHYDGQYVWFAADRGILVVEEASQTWHWISRQHGLPFNKYFTVVFDGEGHLWLGSNRGVTRVSRTSLNAVLANPDDARLETLHFLETEGLISSQINTGGPSSWLDDNGKLWFATALGASSIQPGEVSQSPVQPPNPIIEYVLIDNQPAQQGQHIEAGTARVEIGYAGLGYRMTEHIHYQVRLRGFDTHWVDQGRQVTTQYTSLPPGDYIFEVRSRYPGGEWSSAATFTFYKTAHFYQTLVFWLGVLVLLLLSIIAYVRVRIYRVRRSQYRLQQLVDAKTNELAKLANEDPLTGLANRRAFDERLKKEVQVAERQAHPLSIAIIDLDNFKRINDKFLHAAGDSVLCQVADILKEHVREVDFVARWGGEEFAVVFPGAGQDEAKRICERLRHVLKQSTFAALEDDWQVTMSVGLVTLSDEYDASTALVAADGLLYQAKSKGRDRILTA